MSSFIHTCTPLIPIRSNCILALHCSFKNIPPSSHAHDQITLTLGTSFSSSLLNIISSVQHFSCFKLQPFKLAFIISCHSKFGLNFFLLQTHIKLSNILHTPSNLTRLNQPSDHGLLLKNQTKKRERSHDGGEYT